MTREPSSGRDFVAHGPGLRPRGRQVTIGAIVNKGLTVRGAQQLEHRHIPMILDRIAVRKIITEHLATHSLPLSEGPRGHTMFDNNEGGCVRAVFQPGL